MKLDWILEHLHIRRLQFKIICLCYRLSYARCNPSIEGWAYSISVLQGFFALAASATAPMLALAPMLAQGAGVSSISCLSFLGETLATRFHRWQNVLSILGSKCSKFEVLLLVIN